VVAIAKAAEAAGADALVVANSAMIDEPPMDTFAAAAAPIT
jgi:alkanesulfonate monooxygenase SsuD/methylene tetrahydromethanopterin reductase-like flavin-dependent oxidoreductase (luciferase family)